MMRKAVPVKFRAREAYTGSWVFGFYFEEHGGTFVVDNDAVYHVRPDNIEQLVGYDATGREVYEFDEVNCYEAGWLAPPEEFMKNNPRGTCRFVSGARVKLPLMFPYGCPPEIEREDLNSPYRYKFVLKEASK